MKKKTKKLQGSTIHSHQAIGGRGVAASGRGISQKLAGGGGSGFWTPRGGNKFCLSEGGKGGGNKRQNQKKILDSHLKAEFFLAIFNKNSHFFGQLEGGTVVNKLLVWGGALFWTSGGYSPPCPPMPS